MIDKPTIRQFFRRLNHKPYGLTELVAIDKDGKGIRATGFYEDEGAFLLACGALSGTNNLYIGRNPRPFSFSSSSRNKMDALLRLRASDAQIETLTGISLDIDPIRPKDQPATASQREKALRFAVLLQRFLGGYVDDSGNGAYLWLPFLSPIHLSPKNAAAIKEKCQYWQNRVGDSFSPSEHGLRIDGCFDLSRIKRVIGTFNHKAQKLSSIHLEGMPSDKVRDEILSLTIHQVEKTRNRSCVPFQVSPKELPSRFLQLLKGDNQLRRLWKNPDSLGDRSVHDWVIGRRVQELGISTPRELSVILIRNPFGKYQRDKKKEYIERTVGKLVEKNKKGISPHSTNKTRKAS
jgi:hypothetical protein